VFSSCCHYRHGVGRFGVMSGQSADRPRTAEREYKERGLSCPLKYNSDQQVRCSKGTKSHAITELSGEEFSAIVEANEPIEVLLKYTFTSDSMLTQNSIEARFGSVRLPTTIKKADVIITHVCNVVAVQIHFRLVSFSIKLYTSVGRLPVSVVADSGIHLGFDLTHER
jgi:hypothetical protein